MKTQRRNGLKGQRANSPGPLGDERRRFRSEAEKERPGYRRDVGKFALKGQKTTCCIDAFALTGRWLRVTFTQGDALGWELSGLSGRLCGTCES